MPISADRFERIDDDADAPSPGTNAAEIFAFLGAHPEKAFTQSEIVEATEVTRGSVGPTLVRLREDGRVEHRGTYWRISDHERSLADAASHAAAVATDHEDRSFDREAWLEHAVDPREDREGRGIQGR